MRLSQILLLLSINCLLWSSCAIKEARRFEKISGKNVTAPQPLFERNHSFIYKSKAELFGESVSGLLAIKEMPDESYRTILTSYLGMKFFDFEFDGAEFTVHKIMDKMDRGPLIKLMRSDFQLLLMQDIDPFHLQPFSDPWTGHTVFRYQQGKTTQFYYVDPETQKLQRIEQYRKQKKKVVIEIEAYRFQSASEIHLQHLDKPIEIHLNLIK